MSTPTPSDPFAPDYARQHGAIWFDRPPPEARPGRAASRPPPFAGGWAAVGADPPARFEHWRELLEQTSPEVVWWTNLTQPEIWSLGQWRRFKSGNVFGVDWRELMDEWGISADPASSGAATSVHRSAELWARIGYWLSLWSSAHDAEKPWVWGEGDLPDVLAHRWGWAGTASEGPQPVLQAAYAERITEDIPSSFWQGRRRVRLALPRLQHVRRVWAHRIPTGAWGPIRDSDWPTAPTARALWVQQQVSPVLVRVLDFNWHPEYVEEGSLWLGQRGCRFAGADREPVWLTGEEVARIADWGSFPIDQGYRAEGWRTEPVPPGWPLGENDPLALHAPMPGLLGWAAFSAAASPTRDPARRSKSNVTPRAVWWRAAERELAHQAAWSLHRQGVAVAEYGAGQVVAIIDPSTDAAWLAGAVRAAGLVVPPALAVHLPRPASADLADPVDVAHWLRAQPDAETLWNLDRLVAPWPGPLDEVKTVLRSAAKALLALVDHDPSPEWSKGWKALLTQQGQTSVERVKRQGSRSSG